jgi:hypothetical protein
MAAGPKDFKELRPDVLERGAITQSLFIAISVGIGYGSDRSNSSPG